MSPGRSESVAALVVASASLLATCVFAFLSLTPGIDPAVGGLLDLGFFLSAIVALGSFVIHFVASRKSRSGEPPSRFDRLLARRAAALSAVPAGLVAVGIGALWYASRAMGGWGTGLDTPSTAGARETFASIDTAGMGALLGFGSVYIILMIYLAIRAERAAIRLARDEAGVATA